MIGSLSEYTWSFEDGIAYSHLFINGALDVTETHGYRIILDSFFPEGDGRLEYSFDLDDEEGTGKFVDMTLAIRLPGWSKNTKIYLNNNKIKYIKKNNYAYIAGRFTQGDMVRVELDMKIKRVYANPKVNANNGKAAFSRGPFIYCAEGEDNDGEVFNLFINKKGNIKLIENNILKAEGYRMKNSGKLYSYDAPLYEPYEITLTPYFKWGNRGLNEMRVWLPEIN